MAANLQKLAAERDRDDWLKESQAALSDEMRGDAEPEALAERVVRCLAQRTGAVAAALYLLEDGGLKLRGSYGVQDAPPFAAIDPLQYAASGEGLLLEALRSHRLLVVNDVPAGYLKVRSGLGEALATTLVFLPLARAEETVGVLELALFKTASDDLRELLRSVQEMLVVALQAARSRRALRDALERSQRQAERLGAQEEELRANNQELQAQHAELRVANSALEAQRRALSDQNGRRAHQDEHLQIAVLGQHVA